MDKTLEQKIGIVAIKPSRDKSGKLFNYCSLEYHSGILAEQKAEECINKGCRYYRVYREFLR